jgi:hypothetical protein
MAWRLLLMPMQAAQPERGTFSPWLRRHGFTFD